jgi:membrane-bound inhibitor of C-type lysozyme
MLYGVGQTMGGGYQLFTLDLETGTPSFIGEPNLPQITSIEFIEPSLPVTLTASIDGTGWGNLFASGLTCNGNTCNGPYSYGTTLTITASAVTGSHFDAWSGCDSVNANLCMVTMTGNKSVSATFILNNYTLTASKTGSGSGTLSAPGLSCIDNTCNGTYSFGSVITVSATADTGSHFENWAGCDSTSNDLCVVSVAGNKSVSATFTLDTHTLTATKAGTGSGSLTAPGLSCVGNTCTGTYNYNETVHITATSDTGSVFASWSGCDSVNNNVCTILINGDKNITATFYLQYTLVVNMEGAGNGRVVSSPSGIDCEPTCSDTFLVGTPITLTAYPYGGSAFAYWSGACTGASTTCEITMTSYVEVTAHFVSDETKEYKLTIGKKRINKGDGLVQSDDGDISCGTICTGMYYPDAPITLRATPSPGSLFEGWTPTSLNCGASPTCSFTMDTKHKVKAIFRGPYRLLTKIKSKNDGSGSVTADISGIGTGINCPASSCEDYYSYGNSVVLTAQPGGGAQFHGWKPSSLGCGTSLTCTIPMTKKQSVTATFEGM